ncbi:TPA: hypothetical protein EYO12_04400 [Candidatus Saccharibacteria bacterium]|nr:hypothetical protein [Candidatus Saccharibacteria bacterium]HIO87724.1 hypothetical protein [Candidatus Saccharibacteria bacterium]
MFEQKTKEKIIATGLSAALMLGATAASAQEETQHSTAVSAADCDSLSPDIEPEAISDNHTEFMNDLWAEYVHGGLEDLPDLLIDLTEYYDVQFSIADQTNNQGSYQEEYFEDSDFSGEASGRDNYRYRWFISGLVKSLSKYPQSILPRMVDTIRIVKSIDGSVGGYYLGEVHSISLILDEETEAIDHELSHALDDVLCVDHESNESDFWADADFANMNTVDYLGFSAYRNKSYAVLSPEYFMVSPTQEFASPYAMINVAEDRAKSLEFLIKYGLPQDNDPHHGSPFHYKLELMSQRVQMLIPNFPTFIRDTTEAQRQEQGPEQWYGEKAYTYYESKLRDAIQASGAIPSMVSGHDVTDNVVDSIRSDNGILFLQGALIVQPDTELTESHQNDQSLDDLDSNSGIIIIQNPIIKLKDPARETPLTSLTDENVEYIAVQTFNESGDIRFVSLDLRTAAAEFTPAEQSENESETDIAHIIQTTQTNSPQHSNNLQVLNIPRVYTDSTYNLALAYPVTTAHEHREIVSEALSARTSMPTENDWRPATVSPEYYSRRSE